MTHPYSIFIWYPPRKPTDRGRWDDPVQCADQEIALHVANLMYQDSHAVIKVVRYGLTIECWPNEHAVELCEKQIEREKQRPEPAPPWWLDKQEG